MYNVALITVRGDSAFLGLYNPNGECIRNDSKFAPTVDLEIKRQQREAHLEQEHNYNSQRGLIGPIEEAQRKLNGTPQISIQGLCEIIEFPVGKLPQAKQYIHSLQ